MRLFGFSSRRVSARNDHSTFQEGETSIFLKEDAPKDLACFPLLQEENEHECTSSFLVGDLRITAQIFGSCMVDETYFQSDPKYVHKSDLQSPSEPHNEDEHKATSLGREAEILVEEKATIVSVQEDGNVKNMDNKSYDFCIRHVHLQPSHPCKYKNSSLAS